jgi:hypothetical protein
MVVILTLCSISMSVRVYAQPLNTFPATGPAGIGTTSPANALHLNFTNNGHNDTAFIRLSNYAATSSVYGILGLMPSSYPYYSSLSTGEDLILHEHSQGDIILTNYQSTSLSHPYGAIRFATTPGAFDLPLISPPPHDIERMTIMPNGNIGIDLPPNPAYGLDSALDQVQIGGGSIPPPGYTSAVPGLTIYGGNRFEGMLRDSGGLFPYDWRYIGFNQYINHSDTSSARTKRMQPMSSSEIMFTDRAGGLVDLVGQPYNSTLGPNNFTQNTIFQISGQQGLSLYMYMDSAIPYRHLFDVFPPGYLPYGVTRNTNGLSFFHTPVYIGSDSSSNPGCDFTNLLNVRPDIGDDTTWMLAVNGPALFKEVFIFDSTWADYVFDPSYQLPPLTEVENFVKANHHLPDIESASKIAKTGVPVGRTEEALTKKVEELTLYVIDQNKKIEQLEADIQELKNKEK